MGLDTVKENDGSSLSFANLYSMDGTLEEGEVCGLWSAKTERPLVRLVIKVLDRPKGFQSLKGARASGEPLSGETWLEEEFFEGGTCQDLKSGKAPKLRHSPPTNEALLEEVSKYSADSFQPSFFLGGWDSPSFSILERALVVVNSNIDGGVDNPIAVGETLVDSLRVILADKTMVSQQSSSEVGVIDIEGGTLSTGGIRGGMSPAKEWDSVR